MNLVLIKFLKGMGKNVLSNTGDIVWWNDQIRSTITTEVIEGVEYYNYYINDFTNNHTFAKGRIILKFEKNKKGLERLREVL